MMGESCVCLGSKEIWVFGSFRQFFKRGSLLGNEEPDFGVDAQFFLIFSFGPPNEIKIIKVV